MRRLKWVGVAVIGVSLLIGLALLIYSVTQQRQPLQSNDE
jgi:CHASE1-domain containing sensor protein